MTGRRAAGSTIRRRTPLPLAVALALAALAGCTAPSETRTAAGADAVSVAMYVNGVPVSRSSFAALLVGDSLRFSARLLDAGGHELASVRPTIASHNPNAVSMDATGMMRAVGRGASWIVAAYNSPTRGLIADSTTVGLVCTTEVRAGLVLTVSDSVTGSASGLTGLAIAAQSGYVRDSLYYPSVPANMPGAPALLQGLAFERPGTWEVRVNAAGYAPWVQSGIAVTADLCHVIPVAIAVRLRRS